MHCQILESIRVSGWAFKITKEANKTLDTILENKALHTISKRFHNKSCISSKLICLKRNYLQNTEGSGQFIFPHIHEKTIPAHPRVFLGSPGLCWVMTRRSGHVYRTILENGAPKASWFQHVKISSSDCPIVLQFGFWWYFWKWKPPWGKNQRNLIIF